MGSSNQASQKLLPEADVLFPDFEARISKACYRTLAILCRHAERAAAFTQDHKDPFDRMLVAQAIMEGLILVSNDKALDAFEISRIW